jgi:hypothetical protein
MKLWSELLRTVTTISLLETLYDMATRMLEVSGLSNRGLDGVEVSLNISVSG